MNRTIRVQIEANSYEVPFPNVGQLMDIESLKFGMTNNKYVDMYLSGMRQSMFIIDAVDAISTFSILIPDLKKDYVVKSIDQLDPIKIKPLIKAYKTTYLPWYSEIMKQVLEEDEEIQKEEAEDI